MTSQTLPPQGVTERGSAERRAPKAPGWVLSALLAAMLVIIGVLALSSRQPPPPTIAEFAPQATEQIKDAPSEQSSEFGSGEGQGDCAEGQVCGAGGEGDGLGSPAQRPVINVPRVRKCIGDPPRQVEDPQSPPCVPYWEGDNGGATWKGVTASEVRVVLGACSPWTNDFGLAYEAFFNKRFEFYGRKMRVIFECHDGETDAEMRAGADEVDTLHAPFAVAAYNDKHGKEFVYYDALASKQIISINNKTTAAPESHYQQYHPYQWSYPASYDVDMRNLGAFVCSSLKGRPAKYARGDSRDDPRVFGLMYSRREADGYEPDLGPIERALASCGITPRITGVQSGATIVNMKIEEVTTIICLCDGTSLDATAQDYYPEWVVSHYLLLQDADLTGQIGQSSGQLESTFGTWWWSKQLKPEDSPWYWAIKEGNPSVQFESPPTDYYDARWLYHSMLVLASGIQMAGPELTPETFARGLQRTKFPNPGAGGPPYYQAHIGFGPDDHTAQDDAAVVWWNPTVESNWGGEGAWCYWNSGTRYAIGRTPFPNTDEGLFQGSCY